MKPYTYLPSLLLVALLFVGITSFISLENKKVAPALIDTTMPTWEMAKTHTLEVLDAMPEDKFNYKPSEESKTFASQMVHIAYSINFFNERMIQGKQVQYKEPDPASMTKAEIRAMMEANFDAFMETLRSLSDEDLMQERPFGPNKNITVAQAILFAHDHTTNHRAKANLYIRMNDIVPPNYKFI